MRLPRRLFAERPLGMNLRNQVILRLNPPAALALAKDKARCKRLFAANGLAVPRTYFEIRSQFEIPPPEALAAEFVVKPNRGLGGYGILVLSRRGEGFVDPGGEAHTWAGVVTHIRKILVGEFSEHREEDLALVEERLFVSEKLRFRETVGLPDIRVVCLDGEPAMAMLRYGTRASKGRANLSAGAIGISIDLESGALTHVHAKGGGVPLRPADYGIPEGFVMPRWTEMKDVARKASRISGLGYAGVDLVLDRDDRVRILEINGRPGLEIQNINEHSLLAHLCRLEKAACRAG